MFSNRIQELRLQLLNASQDEIDSEYSLRAVQLQKIESPKDPLNKSRDSLAMTHYDL